MVEHIDAHPTLRDRAIFVGNPDDIVDERLGPQLPMIRDWTERNFEFAGYVTGFDPRNLGHRDELRGDLGYRPDEKVCGAGRRMDFDMADPDVISAAIAEEIGRPVDYREVETDGARRAAETLAELL